VVVEVLEDVPASPEIISICQKLRDDGYTIALDDFVYHPSLEPLIAIAQIIKFDFLLTPVDTLRKTLHRLSRYKLKYLAEKVETYEEFDKALKLGFSYFQGFFFSKPERIRIKEIGSAKINLLSLMAEINQKSTTPKKLGKIIERDVALAYKLLRYVNSSYFYRLHKIESVAHAITYLGDIEIRRYLILVLISELATDKPGELLRLAVVRAKMAELLALAKGGKQQDKSDDIFLLGLFSLLDVMLDTTMEYVCDRLSLSDELKDCLVHNSGPFAPFLRLVTSYEKTDRAGCTAAIDILGLIPGEVHAAYREALIFTDLVLY
jgi:EAL and modified HD-GYP domain-containing signal transduction protein